MYNVYVNCSEDVCIGLYNVHSHDQEISEGPRDFLRTKPDGNLEGQGKSCGPGSIDLGITTLTQPIKDSV